MSLRAGLDVFASTGMRTLDCQVRGLVPILIVTPASDKERVRRYVNGLTCVVKGLRRWNIIYRVFHDLWSLLQEVIS